MTDVQIIVARAYIQGGIDLRKEQAGPLAARVGDRITVKFPYKAIEASKDKEAYELELAAGLGPVHAVPAIATLGDRWAWPDEQWGTLLQRFDLAMPGVYNLSYRASVRYTTADWAGNGTIQEQKQELEGDVTIVVKL